MDELEKKLTLNVTSGDKTYTFRRPNIKQMLQVDVLASQMRGNLPISSLSYGVLYSDMIATLNTYVTEPKNFDFGELYEEEISEIYSEVAKWLNTFRKPVQNAG